MLRRVWNAQLKQIWTIHADLHKDDNHSDPYEEKREEERANKERESEQQIAQVEINLDGGHRISLKRQAQKELDRPMQATPADGDLETCSVADLRKRIEQKGLPPTPPPSPRTPRVSDLTTVEKAAKEDFRAKKKVISENEKKKQARGQVDETTLLLRDACRSGNHEKLKRRLDIAQSNGKFVIPAGKSFVPEIHGCTTLAHYVCKSSLTRIVDIKYDDGSEEIGVREDRVQSREEVGRGPLSEGDRVQSLDSGRDGTLTRLSPVVRPEGDFLQCLKLLKQFNFNLFEEDEQRRVPAFYAAYQNSAKILGYLEEQDRKGEFIKELDILSSLDEKDSRYRAVIFLAIAGLIASAGLIGTQKINRACDTIFGGVVLTPYIIIASNVFLFKMAQWFFDQHIVPFFRSVRNIRSVNAIIEKSSWRSVKDAFGVPRRLVREVARRFTKLRASIFTDAIPPPSVDVESVDTENGVLKRTSIVLTVLNPALARRSETNKRIDPAAQPQTPPPVVQPARPSQSSSSPSAHSKALLWAHVDLAELQAKQAMLHHVGHTHVPRHPHYHQPPSGPPPGPHTSHETNNKLAEMARESREKFMEMPAVGDDAGEGARASEAERADREQGEINRVQNDKGDDNAIDCAQFCTNIFLGCCSCFAPPPAATSAYQRLQKKVNKYKYIKEKRKASNDR